MAPRLNPTKLNTKGSFNCLEKNDFKYCINGFTTNDNGFTKIDNGGYRMRYGRGIQGNGIEIEFIHIKFLKINTRSPFIVSFEG